MFFYCLPYFCNICIFSNHFDYQFLMQFSLVCLFSLNSSLFQNHTMVCRLLELQ